MDKKSERRGLGRGLSALLADVTPSSSATASPDATRAAQVLAVEQKIKILEAVKVVG